MLKAYWKIGRDIIEAEQHGGARAQYGQALIQVLSQKLAKWYGKSFSETNVRNMRQLLFRISTKFGELLNSLRSE